MKLPQVNLIQQAEQVLKEMESLLDKLVETARSLLKFSRQVIVEEDLFRLQQEQEILLEKLFQKDHEFHELPKMVQKELMPQRLKINEKIDQFQQLNAEFIQNINESRGLIQFDQGTSKTPKILEKEKSKET
jgi:hypothetical protein